MTLRMTTPVAFIVAVVFALLLPRPRTALADAAPPLTPPGSSVDPSSSTPVQMWSERVEIDAGGLLQEDPQVHVVAIFRMRNTASLPQNLRARFPLEHPAEPSPTVENLSIRVGSIAVPTTQVREPSYWQEADLPILWAAFEVSFPVATDVLITAEYDIRPNTNHGRSRIDYVLETGAGWFGPIAVADIVVRLPFHNCPVTCMWYAESWPTPSYAGNTLTWRRWNLNPTRDDNFYVSLISPSLWTQIQPLETLAANGAATSADYLELASLYLSAATERDEFIVWPLLVDTAEITIRRGLSLYPQSSDLQTQLACVRWERLRQDIIARQRSPTPAELVEVERIRGIFLRAIALDPRNRLAQDMLTWIEGYEWRTPSEP
jgi:hypothetical protein